MIKWAPQCIEDQGRILMYISARKYVHIFIKICQINIHMEDSMSNNIDNIIYLLNYKDNYKLDNVDYDIDDKLRILKDKLRKMSVNEIKSEIDNLKE